MEIVGNTVVVTGGAHGIGRGSVELFLILAHPGVIEYFRRKSNDHDRWPVFHGLPHRVRLNGMRRMQSRFLGAM